MKSGKRLTGAFIGLLSASGCGGALGLSEQDIINISKGEFGANKTTTTTTDTDSLTGDYALSATIFAGTTDSTTTSSNINAGAIDPNGTFGGVFAGWLGTVTTSSGSSYNLNQTGQAGTISTDGATFQTAQYPTTIPTSTYSAMTALAFLPGARTVVIGGINQTSSSVTDPVTFTMDVSGTTPSLSSPTSHATHTSGFPTGSVGTMLVQNINESRRFVFAVGSAGNSSAATTGFIRRAPFTTSTQVSLAQSLSPTLLSDWVARSAATTTGTVGDWTTTASIQRASAKNTLFTTIFSNKDQTILWSLGYGLDSTNVNAALLYKSSDDGATWTLVETYPSTAGSYPAVIGRGGGVSKAGYIYTVGQSTASSTATGTWYTRRSKQSDGSSGEIVDSYVLQSGKVTTANAFVKLAGGQIAVIGTGTDSSNVTHLIVRLSKDDGGTWTTIVDYNYVSGKNTAPTGGFIDSSGNLFITFNATTSSGSPFTKAGFLKIAFTKT